MRTEKSCQKVSNFFNLKVVLFGALRSVPHKKYEIITNERNSYIRIMSDKTHGASRAFSLFRCSPANGWQVKKALRRNSFSVFYQVIASK